MDNFLLNKCPKPSWQGFRPQTGNPNELRFYFGGASLRWMVLSANTLRPSYISLYIQNVFLFKIKVYFWLDSGVKLKDLENWTNLAAVYLQQSSNGSLNNQRHARMKWNTCKGMKHIYGYETNVRVWNETHVRLIIKGTRVWNETRVRAGVDGKQAPKVGGCK